MPHKTPDGTLETTRTPRERQASAKRASEKEVRRIQDELSLRRQRMRSYVEGYVHFALYFLAALGSYYFVALLVEYPIREIVEHTPILKFFSDYIKLGLASYMLIIGAVHGFFIAAELLKFTIQNQTAMPSLAKWAKRRWNEDEE